MTKQERATKDA